MARLQRWIRTGPSRQPPAWVVQAATIPISGDLARWGGDQPLRTGVGCQASRGRVRIGSVAAVRRRTKKNPTVGVFIEWLPAGNREGGKAAVADDA